MAYEWDAEKAKANFRKHGVQFSPEAVGIFTDPYAITVMDEDSDPREQRFIALGLGGFGSILVVIFIYRGDNIRLISARHADPTEREEYEAQL